ncbi:GGDEF domain-containing response regulator [Salinispira pacifica]|uniref:diguanylate cyclase n=1 Tax=Salinispira pacifica TaxID=1307761 RepID=V5WEC9_9SPIO|nr:diguanylate cyclase [Salinispira pacifica]AHC14163.1 GGDEF domain protein [Salinispira pacifica]
MKSKPIVLIVDDNPQNLQFLAEMLDQKGYEPAVALNGNEAISFIRKREEIDAVLMDVMMPGMNGYEATRKIREFRSKEELPIIFLTALDDRKDISRGFQSGGVDYITKPFDSEELMHRLNLHIELSQTRSQLEERLEELEEKNRQLTDLKKKLELLASTDPLTEILNRRAMSERLHEEIDRARRYNHSFSIIFLDLDHFKQINDSYGHEAGDKALVQFSDILKESVRSGDLVSRWGGEEFLLLVLNAGISDAMDLAGRIKQSAENADWDFVSEGYRLSFTAGVVELGSEEDYDSLFKRADEALYEGKEGGRDRIIAG